MSSGMACASRTVVSGLSLKVIEIALDASDRVRSREYRSPAPVPVSTGSGFNQAGRRVMMAAAADRFVLFTQPG